MKESPYFFLKSREYFSWKVPHSIETFVVGGKEGLLQTENYGRGKRGSLIRAFTKNRNSP